MQQVIIAGAGPVGLVAALVLAQAGIPVQLLEKREQLNQASKASTFHPPTLEILARLGMFDVMQQQAYHVDKLQYRTPAQGILGQLDYALLAQDTPHPYRKHLEQSLLTPLLLKALLTYPQVQVRFASEVTAVHDEGSHVTVQVQSSGRSETLTARFLLGADGAHSTVRQAIGLNTSSSAYPGHVLRVRCDDSLRTLLPELAAVSYLVGEQHSASFLRMPDCWRIILRVPAEVSEAQASSDDWIFQRLQALIPSLTALPNMLGKDHYHASKSLVERCQQGNVFLAGDSVHLTNTRGGMNMNAGIHDAYTLARAMIRALQDQDHQALIQAASERHRIARELLLPRTDTLVSAEGPWIARIQALLDNPEQARRYLYQASMLDMMPLGDH